jgi:hypothetical protein
MMHAKEIIAWLEERGDQDIGIDDGGTCLITEDLKAMLEVDGVPTVSDKLEAVISEWRDTKDFEMSQADCVDLADMLAQEIESWPK